VFKVLARDFTQKGSSVTLQYTSPDGEEVKENMGQGFPSLFGG
jgi:hypothetical protein